MNRPLKHFKQSLSLRILTKFIIAILIYTTFIVIITLLGVALCNLFVWQPKNLLYQFLSFISRNILYVLAVVLSLGYLIIFIYYWIKTLSYLENIIQAAEQIYNFEENLIELPVELKEVENQMNHVKLNVLQSNRDIKESEQRKNDLVVYLAHDLKTPLTSVIGYLTLLREEQEISPELKEKYLSIALRKAVRLEDLVNEFFEITRFNLSNLFLELSCVNLTRMLEQITFEYQPFLDEKNLTCVLHAPQDMNLKCDVNKMQRVFDNLLRNAINYSFEGSVIEITMLLQEKGIALKFTNHGNTIPQEKLAHLFEQFFRLDTARTTKNGGAGLGLAIAKQIIELHHGAITAFSKDELITFEVTLPTP